MISQRHEYIFGSPKPGILNRRTPVRIRTQTQSNLDRSQNQRSNLIMIQASFHWCMISRYIFFSYSMWFLSSVIRSCNNNITMTTHSLTQCWPRALWVTQVVTCSLLKTAHRPRPPISWHPDFITQYNSLITSV